MRSSSVPEGSLRALNASEAPRASTLARWLGCPLASTPTVAGPRVTTSSRTRTGLELRDPLAHDLEAFPRAADLEAQPPLADVGELDPPPGLLAGDDRPELHERIRYLEPGRQGMLELERLHALAERHPDDAFVRIGAHRGLVRGHRQTGAVGEKWDAWAAEHLTDGKPAEAKP